MKISLLEIIFEKRIYLKKILLAVIISQYFVMTGCDVHDDEKVIIGEPENETLTQRLQEELDRLRTETDFPGATVAFIFTDGTSGSVATGVADKELNIPMGTQSRMLAASIGKTFVAATMLALQQEGKLELDTPISHWLNQRPWFSQLPNHDNITLRQLLNHTSGLPDHVYSESFAKQMSAQWNEPGVPFSDEELVSLVLNQAPLFSAGEGWSYTDTGYILINLVIQKVTGNDFYTEINRRFIAPLQLTATTPSNTRELPNLAAGYTSADNPFGIPAKSLNKDGLMVWNPGVESAGGGWISNTTDLAHWGLVLFEGNAIDGNYLSQLLTGFPTDQNNNIQYGLGVSIFSGGLYGPVYGHAGWIPGYTSSLRYYPEHHLAIAIQINTDIGIQGGANPGMGQIEQRLAAVLIENKSPSTKEAE